MVGRWYSAATKGLRFPIDMDDSSYEEMLDIMPSEVPMFGPPSLNMRRVRFFFLVVCVLEMLRHGCHSEI